MRLDEVLTQGTAAAKPGAGTLPNGSLYYETDTQLLWQVVTGAWQSYGGTPGVPGGVDATVTTASLVGKTMTFTTGVLTDFS